MSTSEKKYAVSDAGAWAMNVISSVGIIMANKQVMSKNGYDFRFGEIGSHLQCMWKLLARISSCALSWCLSKLVEASVFPLRFSYLTITGTPVSEVQCEPLQVSELPHILLLDIFYIYNVWGFGSQC